ncbi:uncharacterized protein [Macrobrachium rosenbergii]|uniref:uncharacterized protein n=1 Tax=Macrobrachium rosenbergii TaxID=79674 RepID=UPI0034D7792A
MAALCCEKIKWSSKGQPSWHELTSLMDEFDHRKSKWVELDDAVQDLIENPEEVKRLVYEADDFLSEVDQTRIAAAEVLEKLGNGRLVNLNSRATEGSIISASEPGSEAHSVKLPRLELLKFGRKITEWMPFWDQFKAIVDDKPMPPVNKFMYLRSVLEGEARRVIQGLAQTAANYKSACELLKERYAKPNKIISAHIQDLMQLALSRRSKYDNQLLALRKLQDDVIAHVCSLEALGVGGDQYGLVLAPMILSLLPHEIRLEWSRSQQEEGDLKGLLEFLQREVEGRERAEALQGLNHRKTEGPGVETRQKKLIQGSASALQTSSEDSVSKQQCAFCRKLHPSAKCFGIVKLALHEREKAIRGKRLCLKCLSLGHYARGCWARCSKCKGGHHHALICRKSEAIPLQQLVRQPLKEKRCGESESVTHVGVALEDSLSNFWELESVGIQAQEPRSDTIKPDPILVQFEKLVSYKEGRYEVALPWKSESVKLKLLDNKHHALRRLDNLSRKLDRDPGLQEQYYTVFEEYEKEGIIEEIPPHQLKGGYPVFYLPYRPVVREASISTKIRPVFDGSSRGSNGVSLNDCLESGPSLNPDLVEVLLRFRRWKVALTADITKAFLQIKVVSELLENLYVDDWLSGADSPAEACARFDEACGMLKKAGMSLSKCTSNYKTLPMTEDSIVEGVKVLGLQWDSSSDCFTFKVENVDPFGDIVCTKRNVLSLIARCFDPLGFICPFFMHAKILFQEIWRLGLDWDEPLPEAMQGRVKLWVVGLSVLESLRINSYLFSELSWRDLPAIELHAFGDASERGYGACVYVRVPEEGNFKVTLIAARGKVAPIKKVSLPRLELLGALLCARLVVFVKSALRLVQEVSVRCWTDSTVALAWIKGEPNRWKTFVANRVVEIQGLTPPSCWQHCPGKDNPADLILRGVYAEQLTQSDVWLVGPSWLRTSSLLLMEDAREGFTREEQCETDTVCVAVESDQPLFEFSRWSSFPKALNIVGWVLRFVGNCKASSLKAGGPLTYGELMKAKVKLLYCAQRQAFAKEINALALSQPLPKGSPLVKLDPYLDEEGLLRIKGRLENAELSFESKHPIIVPGTYIALLLVRFQHGLLKHAGVAVLVSTLRNNYWIIRLRQIAKRKLYILLFTCAVVRAVHLELTESLFVTDCNLAIRRFTARRGVPSVFYSDNAKTFLGASNLLKQHYGPMAPQWKFIVPNAPWWGGWWERLIRSVKVALRKTLGTKTLSRSELETTLHEVEACINSRPLAFVGEEPDVANPPYSISFSYWSFSRFSGGTGR